MGFYVDTAEMKKAVEEYQKLSKKAQSQLNTAKTSMNGIINSNAMSGKVGQAISADINNNQNAVIVGLKSSYSAVEMELSQAYQDFKGTTGESSDSAVLSEDVLIKAKSDVDKMKQTYQEQVKSFQTVYSSISDLISLSASKSDFNQVADATKKFADEIIQKVNQFDSKQGNSANEDMIQSLGTQIKAAQKVGGLGYTDPRFLAFANSTALADNVQAFQKKVTEAEEKQRKTKEKDLNSMTPSEMIATYGVDDPDVKKRINDINNGISYTTFSGSVKNTSKANLDLKNGTLSGELSGEASGALATGKVKGQTGLLSGSVEEAVGKVGVSGKVKGQVFNKGVADPELELSGKAYASGVQGKVDGQFGTTNNNLHASGTGNIGYAEASGDLHLNSKGFRAEGKLEASALEGKASGGFTIFGITVDVTGKGKLGSVGVGGKFGIEEDEINLGADLSILAGLGLDITIKW